MASDLVIDRPLANKELRFLTQYNLGAPLTCVCSARYVNAHLSPDAGLDAIRTALEIVVERIAALSTLVAFDESTQTHVFARPRQLHVPDIQLCHGIDLDPASASFRSWLAKTADAPIDLRDPARPPVRVFVLRAPAPAAEESADHLDARVTIAYSHVVMDGKCGPFFHEALSEVLSDPAHVYRTVRPPDVPSTPGMLSIADIWDYAAMARSLPLPSAGPLVRLFEAFRHAFGQLFLPAKLICTAPTTISTISLDADALARLLAQARARGVTVTTIISACACWALASVRQSSGRYEPDEASDVSMKTAATLRPGHPATKKFIPGTRHGAATTMDSILPRRSAFNNIFLCSSRGVALKRRDGLRLTPETRFWDICRADGNLLADGDNFVKQAITKDQEDALCPRDSPLWLYQRRLLKATAGEWARASLSPRVLTGLEAANYMSLLRLIEPSHELSNSGMANLSSGAGWVVDGLTRAIGNVGPTYFGSYLCSSSSGMVINSTFYEGRARAEDFEEFAPLLERALWAVTDGRISDEGTLQELLG